jgi:hypothetical protein
MTSAVQTDASHDLTDVPRIVRQAITLGVIQAVVVVVVSLINRFFEGTLDHALTGVVVALGAILCVFGPGHWTRARTIEGIGGAAGIGLGAALAFMLIDVAVLQPLGTWTNRWYEVGGHSNWWYHPVWWMVSCYLSWQGAFILAHQTAKRGRPSLPGAVALVAVLTAILGAAAAALHIPLAGWNVPTFAVAVLPALAVGTVLSGLGNPRS